MTNSNLLEVRKTIDKKKSIHIHYNYIFNQNVPFGYLD